MDIFNNPSAAFFFLVAILIGTLLIMSISKLVEILDDKKSKVNELSAFSETLRNLRTKSKSYLSTNNGYTRPTAAILDNETKGRELIRTETLEALETEPAENDGVVNTFTDESAQNVSDYLAAKRAEFTFIQNNKLRLIILSRDSDKTVRILAAKTLEHIYNNLGSCDTSSCPFTCAFDCGFGDCGVCTQYCSNGDPACLPPSPPGWPQRCGNDGAAECLIVATFLATFQGLCRTGFTDAAFDAICSAGEVPYIGAFCSIVLGVGGGIACEWSQDQLQQQMANAVGCACAI